MKLLLVLTPLLLGILVSTIYCVKQVGARGLLWGLDVCQLWVPWFKLIGWRAIIPIFITLVGFLLSGALGAVIDLDVATDPGSTAP
jgi:hypothetical protein